MHSPNAIIIVGGLIEKDGRYLLMQESKAHCHGEWNLAAGHLEVGEDIFAGAKREIREETGCEVELTGICQIGNRRRKDFALISIIFVAKVIRENVLVPDPNEVMANQWFTYEEVLNLQNQLRNSDLTLGAINNLRSGIVVPLEVVKIYQEGAEFQQYMPVE